MTPATVADCMNTKFAIIHPEMAVVDASACLIEKDMLGGPVIDQEGILVGWLSEQEILQVAVQVAYHNQRVSMVHGIMRKDVLTVTPEDDPLLIAQQMLQQKPETYPVVDARRKVLGVITRRHILCMLDRELAAMCKPKI